LCGSSGASTSFLDQPHRTSNYHLSPKFRLLALVFR
jgi:hypothetical protein